MYKVSKRPFLLLEVIIAFILIVLCIIPLISPHTFILTEQKKFIQKIELDHLVNLAYADIVERMYRNEIPWNRIIIGDEFEIDDIFLERIQFEKSLPYIGTFRFEEVNHKPKEESPRTLYLLKLLMKFVPSGESRRDDQGDVIGTLNYRYDVFVIRDLGEGELSPEEEVQQPQEGEGGGQENKGKEGVTQ